MPTTLNSAGITMGSSTLTPTGSAPSYTARAWVNFNGTGTVAIRSSGNVTSITDNGNGDYTINFSTAMNDTNYSLSGTSMSHDGADGRARLEPSPSTARTTGSIAVWTNGNIGQTGRTDSNNVNIAIFS